MCDPSDLENNGKKCLVCSQDQSSPHLGSFSCQACAAFFRRSVSLNIGYVCKKQNRCPIFHKVRLICRSCRYDKCIQSGMKREAVQPRQNFIKLPRYMEEFRKNTTSETIMRVYVTSSLSDYQFPPEVEEASSSGVSNASMASPSSTEVSDSDAGSSRYSSLLDMSHDDLLQFYCEQTKFSLTKRKETNYECGDVAFQMCKICPGSDLLNSEELDILYKYLLFSCEIMDSVWEQCQLPNSYLNEGNTSATQNDGTFLKQIERNLYNCLKFWNLNGVEYSSLKAMCIWKLGICDFTVSMKIVAQEQYSSICSALTVYYVENLKKDSMYAATRIADLTLFLGKIFEAYSAMIVGFEQNNIQVVFNNEAQKNS